MQIANGIGRGGTMYCKPKNRKGGITYEMPGHDMPVCYIISNEVQPVKPVGYCLHTIE